MRRFVFLCGVMGLSLGLQAVSLRDLSWQELIPSNAPRLGEVLLSHEGGERGPAALQTVSNAPVVSELAGLSVRLPGYLVPLETDRQGKVTEFLLVPYFGACIHVPPPPSNQIIHVFFQAGAVQEALYQPFWVEGVLSVEHSHTDVADTGYRIQAERVYPYAEPSAQ